MPGNDFTTRLIDWFNQTIAGSPLWAGAGLAAAAIVALFLVWLVLRFVFRVARSIGHAMAGRKRRHTQGYGLGVAPFVGAKGNAMAKALRVALQEEMKHFSFGAPYEVIKAIAPKATKKLGLRDVARKWLTRASADLIVWGYRERGPKAPLVLDILSCEGSLSPAEAQQTRVYLPHDYAKTSETVRRAGAYLVARALQPGLARATAFRAEKLAPVAEILADILAHPGSLPAQTLSMLETDYCAMALHIGSDSGLEQVAKLRRKRLSDGAVPDTETQIAARIDLGRALLGISAKAFDPARVREAMDHLKAAVELLKLNPTIQLANHTTNAVQKGQAMLSARRRFSVTSGGV